MIHVQTLNQRDTTPNPIAFYQTPNGEWDVYQTGDALPAVPSAAVFLKCAATGFKKALNKNGVLSKANAIMADSVYAVDWNSLPTFYSNTKMILFLAKNLKKPASFIGAIFQLGNQIGA
jgi:ABC-type Fe2+-enterobactin transport system substrate-binding protein